METAIRKEQLKILKCFAANSGTFALAGGTALELYYLKHRFSRDLDFFSPRYNVKEIETLVAAFGKLEGKKIKLENEFISDGHARVRFYSLPVEGSPSPLKIDFVEDVLFDRPEIKKFKCVPVYDAKQIYFMKITAIAGTRLLIDDTGREIAGGRIADRDVIDLYYLSKKIEPLHSFLKKLPSSYQRGMIQWYRSFSRQDFRFGFLDIDLYDKKLDSSAVIRHLEAEIQKFMKEELNEY